MEIRDITNENTLLFTYKSAFVDNQADKLLQPYRSRNRTFPIFLDRVFTQTAKNDPVEFLDYRTRSAMDDADAGRLFVLERTDDTPNKALTRLFLVWLSPALVKEFKDDQSNQPAFRANVVFHPFAGLDKYPTYWRGLTDQNPVKEANYLELGVRYLFKEKLTALQHFCALRASGGGRKLDGGPCPSAFAVVVPVSSPSAYLNLGDPSVLSEALRHIARRCYEGVTTRLPPVGSVKLQRIAVSSYSRSGAILSTLLSNPRKDPAFMNDSLREVYAFDVMLDEYDGKTVVKTKKQGYDELWTKLKTWQGQDPDKRIRLYSAEPGTVSGVYQELIQRLKSHGGGYHNPSVKFSRFNGALRADGSRYSGLSDGYEIYSTDDSRSLVVFPSGNPLVYISSENLGNAGGFAPGKPYEPGLEGHSWFVSRLASHALFHSGF